MHDTNIAIAYIHVHEIQDKETKLATNFKISQLRLSMLPHFLVFVWFLVKALFKS